MTTHSWQQKTKWRRLVAERPDTYRRILCAYWSGGGEWVMFASFYYPDIHRIYCNGTAWLGDEIKRHDVYWIDLPLPPDVQPQAASL